LLDLLAAHPNNKVRLSCLEALGQMGDPSIALYIIYASSHFRPNERRKAEEVISRMGAATVPILLTLTKDPTLQDCCRLLAGRTLGRIDLEELRDKLFDIVHSEIERSYFYFYHAHTIQRDNPKIDLEILSESLLTRVHSLIDFIIQLLSVAGSIEDKELLSRSLRSSNQKTHSHAIETLEKTCDRRIFSLILPLIDDSPLENKLQACIQNGVEPQKMLPLLQNLSQSSSRLDQVTAATILSQIDPSVDVDFPNPILPDEGKVTFNLTYELLQT
jgi:HEAT repeat protein